MRTMLLVLFMSSLALSASNISQGKLYTGATYGYPNPQNALDGNIATNTGAGVSNMTHYVSGAIGIDFGAVYNVSSFALHASVAGTQGYSIYHSNDGKYFRQFRAVTQPKLTQADSQALKETCRYLMFTINAVQRGSVWNFPEIDEISVYGTPAAPGADSVVELDGRQWYDSAFTDWNVEWGNHNWKNATNGSFEPWRSGVMQAVGQFFFIDMLAPQTFNQTIISDYAGGIPHRYDIYVADDTAHWIGPVGGGGGHPIDTANFPTQTKRYLKLVLTMDWPTWLEIGDIGVNYVKNRGVAAIQPGVPATGNLVQARVQRQLRTDLSGRALPAVVHTINAARGRIYMSSNR